jgi:hypothetical protein
VTKVEVQVQLRAGGGTKFGSIFRRTGLGFVARWRARLPTWQARISRILTRARARAQASVGEGVGVPTAGDRGYGGRRGAGKRKIRTQWIPEITACGIALGKQWAVVCQYHNIGVYGRRRTLWKLNWELAYAVDGARCLELDWELIQLKMEPLELVSPQ